MIKKRFFSSSIIFITLIILIFLNQNKKNESDISSNNDQIVNLLISPKKCKSFIDKTLYFTSNFRNNSNEIRKYYKIINQNISKHSKITFFSDDPKYNHYKDLLLRNGLLKNDDIYGQNNLFLSKTSIKLIRENRTKMRINILNKYYRFFGYKIVFKDSLYINYIKMKKKYNNEYNFMPETYYYPDDKDIINKKFNNYTLNIDNLWLVKPPRSGGGKGISVLDSLNNITNKDFLITKYITNIDLINNKKYDLRVYALVTGLKPLRIYFYKEGLIRIASQNFTLNYESIQNKYIHLTNTDINLKSKEFIRANSTQNSEANTWNFYMYEKHLKYLNIDFEQIKYKIKDIIIKSMISLFQNLTSELYQNRLNDINFYDLLGYDILITKNYEPFLLEINSGPTITSNNELDKIIKTNLLVDTLNLVGISPYSKGNLPKQFQTSRITIEQNINNALCELTRPRGDFELIFPLKNNINSYKRFFPNINNNENKLFWNRIK